MAYLLNPLPFPQPEQLVTLDQSKPNFETGAIPYRIFATCKKRTGPFRHDNFARFAFSLIGTGEAERVSARLVSGTSFLCSMLSPALGRAFAPGEDEAGAGPVAMISADLCSASLVLLRMS